MRVSDLSRRIGLAGMLCLTASCNPGERTAVDTLVPMFEAVQIEDLGGLYCLLAGAADAEELGATEAERRAGFETWARAQYDVYLEGRDEGWVEPDENPIRIVKMFALGKGTFFSVVGTSPAGEGGLRVETRLRFGYAQIDLSRLSVGTTFYLSSLPPGRMVPVRVPAGARELSVDVLDTLILEWRLIESGPTGSCAGGWKVASVAPVEGSAVSTEITWAF